MNNIEERLVEEKKRMESITVPDELEMRLRSALNTAAPKRKKRLAAVWKIAAVILVVIVLSGNNYNAFAYYGKQLFGFDELIDGTLKHLNDEGMGQIVDKKVHLEAGTELVINGIMTDANQLIMYYTLSNPNGIGEQQGDHFRLSKISGFLTDSNVGGGSSLFNADHTEMKGTMSFDSVSPFSKKLTLHFWQLLQNGQMAEGTLTFPYNPNAALQTKIKQSINKSFKVDKGMITFHSITATPTVTVINGTLNVANFDRVRLALDGIELKANGVSVDIIGSGIQSSLRGMKFDIHYDTLPKQLRSLEIVMKEFVGYEKLNERISLASISEEPFILDGKELWVKHVSTTSKGVEVTIASAEDVMLDGVSIETENEITSLKTTVNQKVTKQKNGKFMKERTLLFDTVIEPEYLLIKGMHYMKAYNNVIELKVD